MSDFDLSACQYGGLGFDQFGPVGEWFGINGFGGSNATYSFGTPTGTAVGSTLTETISNGNRTTTIVYTETQAATATTPALYEITPPTNSGPHSVASGGTTLAQPTFSFVADANGGTDLIETITTSSATETLTYAGGSELSNVLVQVTNPTATTAGGGTLTYSFASTASGTTVTETFSHGSISESITVPSNPTAVFAATTVGSTAAETETFATGNAVETITFVNSSGSNYVIGSTNTAYIAQGSSMTALDVNALDRAEFAISSSGTTVTPVTPSGTTLTSFTANSAVSFAVVSPSTVPAGLPANGSFVEETATFGTHSYSTLFYSATGTSGIYTEIAQGTTIDVTGVANQLAHLPSAVLALL